MFIRVSYNFNPILNLHLTPPTPSLPVSPAFFNRLHSPQHYFQFNHGNQGTLRRVHADYQRGGRVRKEVEEDKMKRWVVNSCSFKGNGVFLLLNLGGYWGLNPNTSCSRMFARGVGFGGDRRGKWDWGGIYLSYPETVDTGPLLMLYEQCPPCKAVAL